MPIILKSKDDVESIRQSGRVVADILAELRMAVRPGIRIGELEELAATLLKQRDARSSTLGYVYEGFSYPASLCTSVNDEVIHGIPGARVLREGDILTLDLFLLAAAGGECKKRKKSGEKIPSRQNCIRVL